MFFVFRFDLFFSDSELLFALLDVRTVHCKHLTKDQRKKAVEIYETRIYRTLPDGQKV